MSGASAWRRCDIGGNTFNSLIHIVSLMSKDSECYSYSLVRDFRDNLVCFLPAAIHQSFVLIQIFYSL